LADNDLRRSGRRPRGLRGRGRGSSRHGSPGDPSIHRAAAAAGVGLAATAGGGRDGEIAEGAGGGGRGDAELLDDLRVVALRAADDVGGVADQGLEDVVAGLAAVFVQGHGADSLVSRRGRLQ